MLPFPPNSTDFLGRRVNKDCRFIPDEGHSRAINRPISVSQMSKSRRYRPFLLLFAIGIFLGFLTATHPRLIANPHLFHAQAYWTPTVTQTVDQTSLAGTWEFQADPQPTTDKLVLQPSGPNIPPIPQGQWQEIAVPSNWYLQGQDLSGVVWYRHQFRANDRWRQKLTRLVFSGVDYTADVWLNGQYLGFHEGYFQPFSFDVSKALMFTGQNELLVRVNSPLEPQGQDWSLRKRLIKGIFSHHDTRPGGAWTDRGQEKNTGGIWAPVFLQVSDQVAIETIQITPELDTDYQQATAKVDLVVNSPGMGKTTLDAHVQLVPENFSGVSIGPIRVKRTLHQGANHLKLQIPVDDPKLWWSWEHGDPNLYRLTVQLADGNRLLDKASDVFGFRTIQFDPTEKIWRLNGRRLFLRGTNYIATQWLSEMTPDKYQTDIDLMKEANINTVRVHAHIIGKDFYKLCDRNGVFIWQDFPLQWGYEDTPQFLQEATRQAKDMIGYLYNHPSILAWSLHNEPPWDADWMKYKYKTYDPEQNRELDAKLLANLQGEDPTRLLHPVSTVGEHPWFGWYSNTFYKYAEPTTEAIISEFGAQALPRLESLRRIFTEDELWPDTEAEWDKWLYHNFQRHETFNIAKVPMGNTTQEFIDNTQQYQSQLIQFAAEAYRRQRYQPVSSIFQFMFVEDWPSVNWGIVDYWRQPKPGHEALKWAYQPVLPSIAWPQLTWTLEETVELELWAINDLWKDYPEATYTYTLRQGQNRLKSGKSRIDLAADSSQPVDKIFFQPQNLGNYTVTATIKDRLGTVLGENQFTFDVIDRGDQANESTS